MLGGQRRQGHVRPDHRLAAERAADILREHPDLRERDAEEGGNSQLDRLDALAGVIERQPVIIPGRRGRQRLDRVVVVGREMECCVDTEVRCRQPVFDIPALHLAGNEATEDLLRDIGISAALVDGGHRRALGVTDLYQRRGVLSSLEAVGHDDSDGLAGIVNQVILHREERLAGRRAAHQRWDQRYLIHLRQVAVRQDPGDALGALRLRGVDRGDPSARYPRADNLGVGEVRQRYLARVAR